MKFNYEMSLKVSGWGFNFDSLTELKYAISIMDEFEFIRPAPSIYYDVATKQPALYVRKCHRRYTADFLIRHRTTLQAYLVEIKPRAYAHNSKLEYNRQVAENFIRFNRYDWEYKVVFDDEILLTEEQLESFESLRTLGTAKDRIAWFFDYKERIQHSLPLQLKNYLSNAKMDFLIYGILARVKLFHSLASKPI